MRTVENSFETASDVLRKQQNSRVSVFQRVFTEAVETDEGEPPLRKVRIGRVLAAGVLAILATTSLVGAFTRTVPQQAAQPSPEPVPVKQRRTNQPISDADIETAPSPAGPPVVSAKTVETPPLPAVVRTPPQVLPLCHKLGK
jgi:hypothetical protein